MSEFGFAYKLKSTEVDKTQKREVRLHRRSIEWKKRREERVNSARDLKSLSPLQELSSNATIDQSYDGKTPKKPKSNNAEDSKSVRDKDKTTGKSKQQIQKMMLDRLAKWKAEKELKKKMHAKEREKHKPFKVAHIDYKDLEKLTNKVKGSTIPFKSKQSVKQVQPTRPEPSTKQEQSSRQAHSTRQDQSSRQAHSTRHKQSSRQEQSSRQVRSTSKTKPTHPAKATVSSTKMSTRNANKPAGKKPLDLNLQKVTRKRGESFAPEEFTFTAPANISSFVFKPLSPNAAASFLNPNLDPGASFIGTDPKRCSTPKSSDSVKKEMEMSNHSQSEQTFKENTDETIKVSDKPKPRRSSRQSRKKSEASNLDSITKLASPENQRKTRSSVRSQDRSATSLSACRRTLDRSARRRLSKGSLDRSISSSRVSASGRSVSSKRTRSERDQDVGDEEQVSKRSKSVHAEQEVVNKAIVDVQEQTSTPRRRSTRIARKSLASHTISTNEKSESQVKSSGTVKGTNESDNNDEVFDSKVEPVKDKEMEIVDNVVTIGEKVSSVETDKGVNSNSVSTVQASPPSTKTPSRRRKSVRRSLHSRTNTEQQTPKPLQLDDDEDESKENVENLPQKKLTRSTKRKSLSSVDFVKPSADCTVLSAKRNATKKKRRKTVYDHTIVKSPEEWINLLKDSPMVEMHRRTPKVETAPPPALDLSMEELEQYSPTRTLNFSTSEPSRQNQDETPMETNDNAVDQAKSMTTTQNYTEQELQVDEVSTTQDSDPIFVEAVNGEHDVPYFRRLLKSETDKLNSMSEKWEKIMADTPALSEDVQGQLRTVVGQAQLLIAQRFKQFEGLVDNCEFKMGENETTCTDLQGFWEMIYFQVEDVNVKFQNLDKLQANDWDLSSIQPKKPVIKKKAISKHVIKKPVKSKFAAFKAGMKNKTAACANTEDKTIDFGFFKVQSPVKSPVYHCAAGSPRHGPKINVSPDNNPVEPEPQKEQSSVKLDVPTSQNLLTPEPENQITVPLITPLKRKDYAPNIPSPLLRDTTPQPRITRSSSVRKTPLPKSILNDVDDDVIMDKNLTTVPKSPAPLASVKNSEKKPRRRSLRTRKSVSICDKVHVAPSPPAPESADDSFSKYLQPMTPRMSMAPKGYSVLDALSDDSFTERAEAGSDLIFSPACDGNTSRTPIQSTESETSEDSESERSRFPNLHIGFTPVAKSARPSLLFTPPHEGDTSSSMAADVPTGQLISFTP